MATDDDRNDARWRCHACKWEFTGADLLRAPNPFDARYEIVGCPRCKSINEFDELCDEPGCTLLATCGFPTTARYRRTCYHHSDFARSAG